MTMELVLWVNNDLSAFAGGTLPEGISGLDGYSQGDNSQHVIFIEGSGHIHELYRNPAPAAQWVDNDLTAFAGNSGLSLCAGWILAKRQQPARHFY